MYFYFTGFNIGDLINVIPLNEGEVAQVIHLNLKKDPINKADMFMLCGQVEVCMSPKLNS